MAFLNLPNSITLLRIALIPLFVLLMLSSFPNSKWYAAALFLLLSLTDFIDGYLARKHKKVTDAGKILDPIADKLLIITALLLLVGRGVEWWMALAIIIREALLTAIRLVIFKEDVVVAASWLGKVKTISQIVAIIAALINFPYTFWLMWAALITTLVSGIDYLIAIRKSTGNAVVNLPNFITFLRLLLLIPFCMLIRDGNATLALICFAIIALLDRIDGIFARISKQQTKFGEIFDTVADWIVIITSFSLGIIFGYINGPMLWAAGFIVLLLALSKLLYSRKKQDSSSSALGKITVGAAYAGIASYIISFPYSDYLAWATLFFAILAMLSFLFKAFRKS
jgi:CDP-diacylglycerol---glycerol-3-phosphate 3-phosphatidyltransferase